MPYRVLILWFLPHLLTAQIPGCPAEQGVDSLILVSRAHTDEQVFAPALETAAAAERLAREQCGARSTAYGSACFNTGRVHHSMGEYETALSWYLQSKTIRENTLGPMHPEYGKSLNNLAIVYEELCQFEQAEPLYLSTLQIRETNAGKQSATYAGALNNLAGLYRKMGDFEQAEPLYLESKTIVEQIAGKQDLQYAIALNNLANLYYDLTNYAKAGACYLESKATHEALGDTDSPDYMFNLDNLGAIYQETGDFKQAETYYREAARLYEKTFGTEHPDYLLSMNHLAVLDLRRGRFAEAEASFSKLMEHSERVLGKDNLDYGFYLQNFGNLYCATGQYAQAAPLQWQARQILEQHVGKQHPRYFEVLGFLLELYQGLGQVERARECFLELSERKKSLLSNGARYLSQRELAGYALYFKHDQFSDISLVQSLPELAGVCYDNLLFEKGFLLQAAQRIEHLEQTNSATAAQFHLLRSYRRRLAAQYALPSNEQQGVALLEDNANTLEKAVARQTPGLEEALRQVSWQEIRAQLQATEAALEFTRFRLAGAAQNDSVLYAALLLLPGAEHPLYLPLFEETQLARLLQHPGKPGATSLNELYAPNYHGRQLYDLIWKPLEKYLAGAQTVFYSPDGLLHRINIGALPTRTGQALAETLRLVALGSTRQLVQHPAHNTTAEASPQAVLYGGIRYESAGSATEPAHPAASPESVVARQRGPWIGQSDSTRRGDTWEYLPWTDVEVTSIGDILQEAGYTVQTAKGAAATEESFKAIGSPRVLHLATHGFFFPNPGKPRGNLSGYTSSENPLIRSGLILAGGNQAWNTGRPLRPGQEDGILTAYEVSQMDLSNTELVVLSACETGLGDIQDAEGVYGLQRAFKIAGARYLLMTLWQVPDFQAQAFMTAFYSHWLDGRQPIPDAFRATQSELRAKYADPYFWAGFVLVE
ncbi:MAG: CHAT domain-containing protein [Saprospiraceae bacterium]|nr:CHAT domain-containing protein [Saprospiraceae bacterium]